MAENMEESENVPKNENSEEENMNDDSGDSDSDDTTEQDEARVRELEKEVCRKHNVSTFTFQLCCSTGTCSFTYWRS